MNWHKARGSGDEVRADCFSGGGSCRCIRRGRGRRGLSRSRSLGGSACHGRICLRGGSGSSDCRGRGGRSDSGARKTRRGRDAARGVGLPASLRLGSRSRNRSIARHTAGADGDEINITWLNVSRILVRSMFLAASATSLLSRNRRDGCEAAHQSHEGYEWLSCEHD